MWTIFYAVLFALVVGVSFTRFDSPVDPMTAALVTGVVVILFRAKRAYGISLHLDELMDEQSDRYDDWKNMGDQLDEGGGRHSERNRIARNIDATNRDMDNLKRIKW